MRLFLLLPFLLVFLAPALSHNADTIHSTSSDLDEYQLGGGTNHLDQLELEFEPPNVDSDNCPSVMCLL